MATRTITLMLMLASLAGAQSWVPTTKAPAPNISNPLLMCDGRVFLHRENSLQWYAYTPDATGSYVNGAWTRLPDSPAGYVPRAFASAVLPDCRILIEGGEYDNGVQVWSNKGMVYDPATNTWAMVQPPAGWGHIGDAEMVVLANGQILLANSRTNQFALGDPVTLQWTETGGSLTKDNDEAGGVMLPDGRVLRADGEVACGSDRGSEMYDYRLGAWACGSQLPQKLYGNDRELGSTVLTYNGKVIQWGGLVNATAILDLSSMTWSMGPYVPGWSQDDGPSALEPNGNVLSILRPLDNETICEAVEYNPYTQTVAEISSPAGCAKHTSVNTRLLLLPSGEIFFTDFSVQPELFTPAGAPVVGVGATIYPFSLGATLVPGQHNNLLFGVQLNSLAQGSNYGDDNQNATNYPIVRLVDGNGNVTYANTHDGSYSGIAPGVVSYTHYDLPANMAPGQYQMQAVTNGISSNSVMVTVR